MTTGRTTWTAGRPHVNWSRVLLAIGVLSGGLLLGGLFPGMGLAGTLEPPAEAVDGGGDPASTGATYPAWDKILPANDGVDSCSSSRFTCVMGGAAVRDNETGLVWEQSPLAITHTWSSARSECTGRTVGDRKGWRLPSVHELASQVDPGNPADEPDLAPGHPFSNVQPIRYWSATTDADNPMKAWGVNFFPFQISFILNKTSSFFVWCVRGGMNAYAY